MFKKLRNKFLFLNLVTISVMMLISFTAIYMITYRNVHEEINMRLNKISEPGHKQNNTEPVAPIPGINDFEPPPDRSFSFTVVTDSQWNTLSYNSLFETDNNFIEAAKKAAVAKGTPSGSLTLEGTDWAYSVKSQPNGYKIMFLDITQQENYLTTLIYTFMLVAFGMLIVIYFISRVFANKSIKPVKEAFYKQKQFIADASHELKTPLAVINTNVDVLLSNSDDKISDQSKWLNYIKSESERMAKLTNDLLYLTQVDYSEVKMIFSDFNLSDTVENVLLTMEAVVFEKDITLESDIEQSLFTHGNAEQIQQVILILIDNAIKYTNSKGRIDVSLKKSHNTAILSVSNTGEGIAEEHINRIFDRFYRTDKSRARKTGGYGLGLAIAKAIVEHHHGKISVTSVPNEKTTFTVELPRVSN